jgi:phosphoribosyl-AMP cyclohydrolase
MSASESNSLRKAIPVSQIRYDERGLVPTIVQDYLDGTILMMAWMNRERKNVRYKRNLVLEPLPLSSVA